MTDKTLDGYCCKKDAQGNPHTFYIDQSAIPVLLDDCAQGEGVRYYLASIVDKRIKELERKNTDMEDELEECRVDIMVMGEYD